MHATASSGQQHHTLGLQLIRCMCMLLGSIAAVKYTPDSFLCVCVCVPCEMAPPSALGCTLLCIVPNDLDSAGHRTMIVWLTTRSAAHQRCLKLYSHHSLHGINQQRCSTPLLSITAFVAFQTTVTCASTLSTKMHYACGQVWAKSVLRLP